MIVNAPLIVALVLLLLAVLVADDCRIAILDHRAVRAGVTAALAAFLLVACLVLGAVAG